MRPAPDPQAALQVAVVGCGIAGASVAFHLAQFGVDCVVLDERDICSSATGRNGGQLKPVVDLEGAERRWGRARALAVLRHEHSCFEAVRKLVTENGIDCDWDERGAATLYDSEGAATACSCAARTADAHRAQSNWRRARAPRGPRRRWAWRQ